MMTIFYCHIDRWSFLGPIVHLLFGSAISIDFRLCDDDPCSYNFVVAVYLIEMTYTGERCAALYCDRSIISFSIKKKEGANSSVHSFSHTCVRNFLNTRRFSFKHAPIGRCSPRHSTMLPTTLCYDNKANCLFVVIHYCNLRAVRAIFLAYRSAQYLRWYRRIR